MVPLLVYMSPSPLEDSELSDRTKRFWQHVEQDRQQRLVRKEIKSDRVDRPVRRKDWLVADDDVSEEPDRERVTPRGVAERKRKNLEDALARLGYAADHAAGQTDGTLDDGAVGTVYQVSSGLFRVRMGEETLVCALRGSLKAQVTGFAQAVCVGDRVRVTPDGAGGGAIDEVLPRTSLLCRRDVFRSHLRQPIAANAQQLLAVASWATPPLWHELMDRYLITAVRNGLKPLLCLNKVDLAPSLSACAEAMAPYVALGHPVILASAQRGDGVEELRGLLVGRSTVLTGLSGVGKSSLLTAIEPGLQLKTGHVSHFSGDGRHTTTQVTLWPLTPDGCVIDTPGIREFGLEGITRAELGAYYMDLVGHGRCAYADCTHLREPGCAVRRAVEAGLASGTRYHSYAKIYEELPD